MSPLGCAPSSTGAAVVAVVDGARSRTLLTLAERPLFTWLSVIALAAPNPSAINSRRRPGDSGSSDGSGVGGFVTPIDLVPQRSAPAAHRDRPEGRVPRR